MATPEQEEEQRGPLQEFLEKLNQIDPESLVRTDVLGEELSFEAGLPVFQRTLGLFKDLSECNLDNAPYEVLTSLNKLVKQAFSQFEQIQNFSVQQHPENPASHRDQLINQLRDQWNAYYIAITPHISYSIRRGTDFEALEREARGTLSLTKELANDLRTEKDKILADMQGALEKVREAATEAGVAQHAIHFKDEAESHRKQSYWWLGAAVVFGAVTIGYALYSLGPQLHDIALNAPTGRLIQLALSRVIVISILSFGLIWCARNYAASRHNSVINKHRQNALSTFETFVKATSDIQTKDSVLIQATQSIFAPQPSGYLKRDREPQHSSQIIEVIRSLTGGKE